jgi:GAF domain-containing protein
MSSAVPSEERARNKALLDGKDAVVSLVDGGRPLAEILDAICRLIEAQGTGVLCSVLLLDDSGHRLVHGAAPSLPKGYCEAIDGTEIGPNAGSCGAAAYTGRPCIVEDISTHPNWAPFRRVAFVEHGLRACWSTPVRGRDGRVVATFAMYYREPKLPSVLERKLTDFSSHLVAIALERDGLDADARRR